MDYKAKQAAIAAGVAALVAANPHLVPVSACKGGALIAATKNMKVELGLAFPGVKFSIKSSRFSMGDSITVSWIDGPTSAQVDEIIDRYSAGSFNGMDDSYTYSRDYWIKAFGDAKYVHSRRTMSDAAIERAIRLVRSRYGSEVIDDEVTVAAYRKGSLWALPLANGWKSINVQEAVSEAAYRQCYAITKPYVRKVALIEEV